MTETLEALCHLVQERFDIDASKIDPDAPVLESGLDSLALTELLFAVEEKFGVELLEAARQVATLGGLAALIDKLRHSKMPEVAIGNSARSNRSTTA